MKAYYQGEVDYFCAIYAIINSIRISSIKYHRFTLKEGCAFYQHMVKFLLDSDNFLEVLYDGTSLELMDKLLAEAKKYVFDKFGLKMHYKLPLKYKSMPIGKAGDFIGKYLSRSDCSCIMRLHNKDVGDHWSVVLKKAFSTKLRLFDSYFYPAIDIKKSTWEPYQKDGLNHIVKEGIIFVKVFKQF